LGGRRSDRRSSLEVYGELEASYHGDAAVASATTRLRLLLQLRLTVTATAAATATR